MLNSNLSTIAPTGSLSPAEPAITRRGFNTTAATGLLLLCRSAKAAEFSMRQYHNQPPESALHKRLGEMWDAVSKETGGRVQVTITPENNRMKDGDPDPLAMLMRGELDFYTASGNVVASVVPAANVQATPYAFRNSEQAFRVLDGYLGDYLRDELKVKGIYAMPYGCFDNGMHQLTTATKPIRTAADMQGLKIRVPGSPIYHEFFKTFGAVTTGMNINMMYDALKSGRVEAQEDPLDVAELFKLYDVQKYVSMTNHSWSGYNLMANLKMWQTLPADIRGAIERNTRKFTHLQRADTARFNGKLRAHLARRGMVFNNVDTASFRAPLGGFYVRWKESIGSMATRLLEAQVGRLHT